MESAMTIANKRNQIVKIRTNFLLKQIDNERKLTERMHETLVRYRFQAKFDTLHDKLINQDIAPRGSITSVSHNSRYRDIKSAPTHRSVRHIPEPSNDEDDLINYIENLLYTNKEIDVEKLLCLQLIANHKIWLSPDNSITNISNNTSMISETVLNVTFHNEATTSESHHTNAPLEAEKSLLNQPNSFPVYLIEFKELSTDFESLNNPSQNTNESEFESLNTSKLNSICNYKTLVNLKLLKMIRSVSNALKSANPQKSTILLAKSKDPAALRELLRKPSMQAFINSLRNYLFIAKPNSYHLIEQNVLPIYLECEPSTHLEKLILDIKDGVIQQANSICETNKTWKMQLSTTQVPINTNTNDRKVLNSKSSIANIDSIIKTSALSTNVKSSVHSVASDLRKKFLVTQKREMGNLQIKLKECNRYQSSDEKKVSENFEEQTPAKPFSLRRSSCEACLQKYKLPHATPKSRTVLRHKPNDPNFLFSKNISHTSTPMLTQLLKSADAVKKQQANMFLYPNSPSYQTHTIYNDRNKITTKELITVVPTKTELFQFDTDATKEDLICNNNFLAKLEKQIILRETERRLKNFLESPF